APPPEAAPAGDAPPGLDLERRLVPALAAARRARRRGAPFAGRLRGDPQPEPRTLPLTSGVAEGAAPAAPFVLLRDVEGRVERHALVELDHIGDAHADAPVRGGAAERGVLS